MSSESRRSSIAKSVPIGKVFGWRIVCGPPSKIKNSWCVPCLCVCLSSKDVHVRLLLNGKSQHCGCKVNIKHGRCKDERYSIWLSMRNRCNNPNAPYYHCYGGKGVKVCDRWSSFVSFAEDMGDRPSEHHSLDRINNDGDYEPGNCRWATAKQQNQNLSTTIRINYAGEQVSISDLSKRLGISRICLYRRYKAGMQPPRLFAPGTLHKSRLGIK